MSLQNVLRSYQDLGPPNVYQVEDTTRSASSRFPVALGHTDPEDEKYAMRSKLIGPDGIVPNVGQAIVGDRDFDYIQRKKNNAQNAEFQAYIMKQADLSTPEKQHYWFSTFPWMKMLREQEVDREARVQKKMADIKINGPQSEEDWAFLYAYKNGLIKSMGVPLYSLGSEGRKYKQKSFVDGMFSLVSTNLFPNVFPKYDWNTQTASNDNSLTGFTLPREVGNFLPR